MKKNYFLFFLLSFKLFAQNPELDPTFNVKETGKYQQNIGRNAFVLPNEKILTAIQISFFEYHVLLLNPDGSVDPNFNTVDSSSKSDLRIFAKSDGQFLTFGSDGKLMAFNADGTRNPGFIPTTIKSNLSSSLWIKDIIYQEDGKIIIFGVFNLINDVYTASCVRLNADGSLESTFKMSNVSADSITIQSDGKYVVSSGPRIARYDKDGKADTTFKVNTTTDPKQGFITNGFENADNSTINDIVVQPDGKIIVGGCNFRENSKTVAYYIVRLNADGTRDTNFKSLDSRSSNVYRVYLQKDNKIVLNMDSHTFIRLNSDGTIDNTFNYVNTVTLINRGALFFQGDKIIVSSHFKDSKGITRGDIHRINLDGSLDLTFNPHSGLNTFFDVWDDTIKYPYTAKTLLDQKILLVGDFTTYNDNAFRNMCRITQNGEFDSTFKLDPSISIYAEDWQNGYSFIQQNDGKIILLHNNALTVNGIKKSLIRLNNDGSLDNSFNFTPPVNSLTTSIIDIKLLSNGKFLIIGQNGFFTQKTGNYNSYNVVQLNSDGSIDTSYKPVFYHKPLKIFTLSNKQILISFLEDNRAYTYFPVLKLNENGTVDSSFTSGYQPYTKAKELSNGKLLIEAGQNLTRVNSNGSADPTFTSYSLVKTSSNNYDKYDFYENGQINLFFGTSSTNSTKRLTFSSEGTLLNTTVYNTSGDFEIQNCEDLLFYGYFSKIGTINKNGIVRYKTSNTTSTSNPAGEIFQPFTNGQTLADLKVAGSNIQWYSTQSDCGINNKTTKKGNSTDETILPSSTLILDGITYYASQTINGIESSYRLPVTVYAKTLSVKDNILPNLVTYPNPIKDYYTISNNEEIDEVQVYNSLGQLVINNKYNSNNIKVDFSSLHSGIYFVKIYVDEKVAIIKTIKN